MPAEALARDMTQMNTRISRSLKQRGDAVIERAGLTPSQAIRQLYKLAIACEHNPTQLKEILFPRSPSEQEERRLARAEAFRAGAERYTQACAALGLPAHAPSPLPDDETLRYEALTERYGLE